MDQLYLEREKVSRKQQQACIPQGEATSFGLRSTPFQLLTTPISLLVLYGSHWQASLQLIAFPFSCLLFLDKMQFFRVVMKFQSSQNTCTGRASPLWIRIVRLHCRFPLHSLSQSCILVWGLLGSIKNDTPKYNANSVTKISPRKYMLIVCWRDSLCNLGVILTVKFIVCADSGRTCMGSIINYTDTLPNYKCQQNTFSCMSRRKQQQQRQYSQSLQSGSYVPSSSGLDGESRQSGTESRQSQSQVSIADGLDQRQFDPIKPTSQASRQSQFQKSKVSSAQDSVQYKPTITQLQDSAANSGAFIRKSRLREIQQQKERLKIRMNELEQAQTKTSNTQTSSYEENITRLLQKKQKMEAEKAASEAAVKRAEQQYIEKKQLAKRVELERLARERIQLEQQILNRQTILDTAKLHTEGIDTKMLVNKALARNISQSINHAYPDVLGKAQLNYGVRNTVANREAYDETIREMERRALAKAQSRPLNIQELNQRRMTIFNEQEKLIRKKILLKQMQAQDPQCWQKLQQMTEQQMDQLLERLGHDVDDFRNPVPRQLILDNIENIRDRAKDRIERYRKQPVADDGRKQYMAALKLKDDLSRMNPATVRFIRNVIDNMIDTGCDHYDRLLKRLDHAPARRKAEQANLDRFKKKEMQQIDNTICTEIVEEMVARIGEEMFSDGVQEIYKLHELAWKKTFGLILPGLNEKDQTKILDMVSQHEISLQYSQPKAKIKFKKEKEKQKEKQPVTQSKAGKTTKKQKLTNNIFDVSKQTHELTLDIPILQKEDAYFSNMEVDIKTLESKNADNEQIVFDKTLYVLTPKQIRSLDHQLKISIPIEKPWKSAKFNLYWMLFSEDALLILHKSDIIQAFNEHIGDRIGTEAGEISTCCFYPVTTILGSVCSVMIGFNSGTLLKYNLNRNPVNGEQSNISFFEPLLDHIRTGQDPKLPNEHSEQIQYKSQKVMAEENIHEYRQFLQSPHTTPIISILFYSPTQFVTIDESIKGCVWSYERDEKESYEPADKFQIKIEITGYRYPENPVMKTIPLPKSPEEVFQDYFMDNQKLQQQIYVSPKQSQALFSKGKVGSGEEVKVWRIQYNSEQGRVDKIYEEIYLEKKFKGKAIEARIWNGIIFILTKRPHTIKQQLDSMKIIAWNTKTKKLQQISYEIDIYAKDKVTDFLIVDSIIESFEVPGIVITNGGRAMVFSMITGQLIRIIVDPLNSGANSKIEIRNVTSNPSGLVYASNKKQVFQLAFIDENTESDKYKTKKEFQKAFLRYLNT